MSITEGELIWVRNSVAPEKKIGHAKSQVKAGFKLWLTGSVISKIVADAGITIKVKAEDGSVQECLFPPGIDSIENLKLRNMDEKSSTYLVDDLINLPFLNEPEILRHVKERFNNNIIYTLTGPILIVMNPFMLVKPSNHNDNLLRNYTKKTVKDAALTGLTHDADHEEGAVFIPNAPGNNEIPGTSILVGGESNSGKTEVARTLTNFLLEGVEDQSLTEKIIDANIILESFGNAETMYSKNSSRYGKYLDIFYNAERTAVGGGVRVYLLEQTRVVNQIKGERNFHIFYELLAGATEHELADWGMTGLELKDFPTLVKGRPGLESSAADKFKFGKLRKVMSSAFDDSTIQNIFRIVAGVLNLCRIEFNTVDMGLSGEGCEIKNKDVLENAATLLGLEVENLERTLTIRTIVSPRGEHFVKNLTRALGMNGRDAIAKAIFERLFSWVVKNINTVIATPQLARCSFSVSILDIYGFDAFLENSSFEQLCINFVNEALQQQFNQQIFKMEIAEYEAEGLSVERMNFSDNQDSLDLIGLGIFKLLDDQCKIPKATDARLAQQMYKDFGATAAPTANKLMGSSAMAKMSMSTKFSATKAQQVKNQFCVEHFAGSVVYSVTSFIEKNMDELPSDADELIQNSKNPTLSTSQNKVEQITDMVQKLQINTGRRGSILGAGNGGTPVRHNTMSGGSPVPSGTPQRGKTIPSAATQFKNELAILVRHINATIPHYIRCIKPVTAAAQSDEDAEFDELCVAEQVQYSGILEAVSVNRSGLPVKIGIYEFFARYSSLATVCERNGFTVPLDDLEDSPEEMKSYTDILINSIVNVMVENPKEAVPAFALQQGKTKVFMQKRTLEIIEARRQTIVQGGKKGAAAILIQAEFRGYMVRKKIFDEKKKAIRSANQAAAKLMKVEEVPVEATPVQDIPPVKTTETMDGLDSKKTPGVTPSYARISQYLASKVSEFNKQDVALLKAINNIITASKANDQVAIISLDVENSRTMLEEWTRSSAPGIFQLKLEEVSKLIDYGYKLLKSEKLIPKSVKTKFLSLGVGKKKNTDEDRMKAAKSANKVITKEHKMFKGIYVAVEQIRELRNTSTSEQTTFMKRMHRREDEYQQKIKTGNVTEQDKLTLKNLHEQENTKLIRQIQCAKKVIDICTSLEQYYLKYVSVFVEEYGVASDFKKSFDDENLYMIALTELLEESKPLLSAEKKALESGVKKTMPKTSQELFPLTFPTGGNYKMSMIQHQTLNFNFMPFLPGEEFLMNSLTMLISGRTNMHPIRFIKVMGRSKNNDGKVAYYQTSPGFTQKSLKDVLDDGTYDRIDEDSFTAVMLSSMLLGISDGLPENFMMNTSDPDCIKVVGIQNDPIFSAGSLIFEKDGNSTFDSKIGSTFNALYLLPNMDEPVAADIADIILNVSWAAEDIISSWMRELYMQNQRYQSLITSGFNAVDLDTLQLPMKLPTQSIIAIYKNLVQLTNFFKERGSEPTNHEVLELLFPAQAKYYKEQRAAAANNGIPKTMDTLSDAVKAKPISKHNLTQKNKQSYIKTVETLSQEYTSSINFERIVDCPQSTDPKRPHICSIIADNLAFLPSFTLKGITEAQMLDMFRTSSTKSNTKELILTNMNEEEAAKIKSNDELTAILVRHGLTLVIK